MASYQLNRFALHSGVGLTYSLYESDGVTPKTLYTNAGGQTAAPNNRIHTDANGTAIAYFYGDALLKDSSGNVSRSQIRNGYEYLDPAVPANGGAYVRAIDLLTPTELAAVRNPNGQGGSVDLAPKLQAWLDAAYLLTGSDQSGSGGHGCWMDLDAGTWLLSTLQLRPGMTVAGLADRFEVRLKQTSTSRAPLIDILGRGQNQDVIGRRTAVHLYRLDLNCNGLLDLAGDPVNGINLRIDPDNGEIDDRDANRTGLIAEEVQVGGASGWGCYNLKRGKLWLSKCQFAGNGLALLLPNGKVGGLFSQGPDSFFNKVYCGNNGGPCMHIKSSATPSITEIELGVSKQPGTYPSLYIENCTDAMIGAGGNCNGRILVEGEEDDSGANEYDTETRINFYDFGMVFKEKSFVGDDLVYHDLGGYFTLKNIRGVNIENIRFMPATDDDIAEHHYIYRPTNIIEIVGARTRATFKGPLPPLNDWNWPAGTPEEWPGSEPTNDYDSITNHPARLLIQTTDPSDTTHANLFDRIRGLYETLNIDGVVEQPGATVVPKTEMPAAEIDVLQARNNVTLTGNQTWTFSDVAPTNGTTCGVTVKASGADRTVTLPAGIVDLTTGASVTAFTVIQNRRHWVAFFFLDANWYIAGYPMVDPLANANLGNFADDAAAAAGLVPIDGFYRTGSILKKRIA